MKLLLNGLLAVLAVIGIIVAVVVVRTLTIKVPADTAFNAPAVVSPSIDVNAAAQHLSTAVRFQTVSHADKADDHPEIFAGPAGLARHHLSALPLHRPARNGGRCGADLDLAGLRPLAGAHHPDGASGRGAGVGRHARRNGRPTPSAARSRTGPCGAAAPSTTRAR